MDGADRWLWDDVTSGSKIFTQAGASWDDVGVCRAAQLFFCKRGTCWVHIGLEPHTGGADSFFWRSS